ncbi:CoA-binding protein [Paraliomyxa miuraensis]|uniref:CoA-binding protein n=1 Tax=Paraliomyxa miuraensis TaxID=376150 RepID=UPI00225113F0|nr:CoA-binding protein [Paraliomyxa miuraensis]MCX4242760.1 CoA-binding protein [Paraliomyxa miuraensis]
MDDAALARIFDATRTIAVLGIHDDPSKAASYVPQYLHRVGYRILGVNPKLAGQRILGEPVVATLAELSEAVDMVDVFRRSELLPEHLPELLAMQPRPAVVWMQLGVRHDAVAERLRAVGIEVVSDRCTLADHRRLGLPGPGAGA